MPAPAAGLSGWPPPLPPPFAEMLTGEGHTARGHNAEPVDVRLAVAIQRSTRRAVKPRVIQARPKGSSMAKRQVPSDCRHTTSIALPAISIGCPSGPRVDIVQSL